MHNESDDLDFALSSGTFKPNCIDKSIGLEIIRPMQESVKQCAKELFRLRWKFYFVNQQCGRCYYREKVITLPSWAMKREMIYAQWYLCHEMAHAKMSSLYPHNIEPHGREFMEMLIFICPKESIEFELEYKPRNATAAGIGVTTSAKKVWTLDDL